ncbi:UDP-Glycosyltransferase/glycogen phosphorylase [Diplocarpon rosae]|nr:UDP-Glycosyltransferase/glycogen phosphorylase [Diplocarpon rosae]
MSTTGGKEVDPQDADDAIPTSIIAQAEAAIVGNFEDDEPESLSRLASRIHRPNFSRSNTQSSTRSVWSNRSGRPQKSSRLQVPDILSNDQSTEDPPAYGAKHDQLELSQDGFDTKAKVTDDGRLNININQKTRKLSDLLVPALRNQLSLVAHEREHPLPPGYIPPALGGLPGQTPPPKLNVVIHVVGSRGDVQPFLALGKTLKATYGHRVRLATHPTFKVFVEDNGLEFFSIGGDPSELMAFMVKNPGLMPGFDSLKSGDVGKRRKGMEEIVLGCWRSCIEAGNGLGAPPKTSSSTDNFGFDAGINMESNPNDRPFIADAIIANPPSFAHIHIAEKMGIPLHMMFTMPWSPTQQFPHPLANIQSSNADVNMTNFISYALVEMMTWQGLGDVINRFRERALGLEPISLIWAPGMLSRLRVPYTYCWSPALIPKPKDWGQHISISGFYFLSLASSYTPEPELAAYLAAGPSPVYIGFGSIVVDDPDAMTKMIFEAVKKAGVRALVSKGWGGLGADALVLPEGVFMLGNVPHDWLFQHVSCVVHHGGAGTTAAGIATGKPTVVVPFFGDQPFWGAMVCRAGAGPVPIPNKQLTSDKLAAAITEALKSETLERARELGAKIHEEKGCETDFPIEIFRTVKKANIKRADVATAKKIETQNSGDDIPSVSTTESATSPRSQAQVDLGMQGLQKSRTGNQHSRHGSASIATPKTSHESVARSSIDTPTTETVLSNIGSTGRSSLKEALGGTLNSSGSRSSSRDRCSFSRSHSKDCGAGSRSGSSFSHRRRLTEDFDPSKLTLENATRAGKGVSRIVGAGLKSPMDFSLGIARGFHNAPKLYGDDTVRPQEKVTDFQSGLKAAGKEFGYGMFDGITGLITQPLRGAEKEGAAGLIKGIGKGIGGLILKPGAAVWGIPGYTFMGIHKEVRKMFGTSVLNYIISARTAQGYEDAKSSTLAERSEIIKQWHEHKDKYQSQKMKLQESAVPDGQESGRLAPKGFMQTRHLSFDERKKLYEERRARRMKEDEETGHKPHAFQTSPIVVQEYDAELNVQFEHAIHTSVAATSRGDIEEDMKIERAIRASVRELQSVHGLALTDQEALDRAIQASIKSTCGPGTNTEAEVGHAISMTGEEAEHQAALETAIQASLSQYQNPSMLAPGNDIDADKDKDIKLAIQMSKHESPHLNEDDELKLALQKSKDDSAKARREEEIVLEYVKRQSLVEDEHKKTVEGEKKEFPQTRHESDGLISKADEEALIRAIEESMKSVKDTQTSGPDYL